MLLSFNVFIFIFVVKYFDIAKSFRSSQIYSQLSAFLPHYFSHEILVYPQHLSTLSFTFFITKHLSLCLSLIKEHEYSMNRPMNKMSEKTKVDVKGKIEFDAFQSHLVLPYSLEMHHLQTFQ